MVDLGSKKKPKLKVYRWGTEEIWGFEFVFCDGSERRISGMDVHAEARQNCFFLYENGDFCVAYPDRDSFDNLTTARGHLRRKAVEMGQKYAERKGMDYDRTISKN